VEYPVRGVALKFGSAPSDLAICPHLVSLGAGMAGAASTIHSHAALGACSLSARASAFPRRELLQGSTPKKDATSRRTAGDGSPRKGAPGAKSLNAASKESPLVPVIKPALDGLSNDMAVLLHASEVLGLPLYEFTDDFKWFFNQLAVHPS
jgi:hypothetical protein